MSIADLAEALVGLRENNYRDHQRLASGYDELRAAIEGLQQAMDATLDRRLAASAQAVIDVERRLQAEYERRIEAMLMTLIEVTDRLTELERNATSTDDPAELQRRLESCSAPRDRVKRILEEAGVRAFSSEGEPYDPHRHEVVRREHRAECRTEYVQTELRPGYVREGTDHTLVRAKVVVAAPPVVDGGQG
jgi:molecular chaperone GrpE